MNRRNGAESGSAERKRPFAVFVLIPAGIAFIVVLAAWLTYLKEIGMHGERVLGGTSALYSPECDVRYAVREGVGTPVLMIHGSGGGFDQGMLLAEITLPRDRTFVAPSRFGYPGSGIPEPSTAEAQADVFDDLMNSLGYDRYHVLGMSAGGPTSVRLALRHPERIASLTLVSCGLSPQHGISNEKAGGNGDALALIVKNDFAYWFFSSVFRRQFIGFCGVPDETHGGLPEVDRALIDRFISEMNPASLRASGIAVDRRAILPGESMKGIRVPTLLFHAVNDTLQLYGNSLDAAEYIPGSRLITLPDGGHFAAGLHRNTVARELRAFLERYD